MAFCDEIHVFATFPYKDVCENGILIGYIDVLIVHALILCSKHYIMLRPILVDSWALP